MTQAQHGKRRRNWRSLSLRSLIVLITVIGVGTGLGGHRIRVQRNQSRAIEEIRQIAAKNFGTAKFGFEDPWARSHFSWMRGKFVRATLLDMRRVNVFTTEAAYGNALANLPYLKSSYLADCRANDEVVLAVSNCHDLERLYLNCNSGITDAHGERLMALKKLNTLDVTRTKMTWKSFSKLATLPELRTFLFDHEFSSSDLRELAQVGKLHSGEIICRDVDANALESLLEIENIDDLWFLGVYGSTITAEWQSVLERLKVRRLNFVDCKFDSGLFDTYQLPYKAKDPRRGWIQIVASQSEFDDFVSKIQSASSLRIEKFPEPTSGKNVLPWLGHDLFVTINNPNGQSECVKFLVEARSTEKQGVSAQASSEDAINLRALRSMKSVDHLRVNVPVLFDQLEPALVRSAKGIVLLDEDPHSKATFMKSLGKASAGGPMAAERLSIIDPTLANDDLKVIAQMKQLRTLSLSAPGFDGSGLSHLASLEKLDDLAFRSGCRGIENLTVEELVKQLRQLKRLKNLRGPLGWVDKKLEEMHEKMEDVVVWHW